MDHVFVSHWPPLVERREYLQRALEDFGLKAEWVTHFDKRTLAPETIAEHYRLDPEVFEKRNRVYKNPQPTEFSARELNGAEIANAITHIHFLKEIVVRGYETTLILEDDVLLAPDFKLELARYLAQLPRDWDIFYPGSGSNDHVAQSDPRLNVYFHPERRHRTADCYLIRLKAARRILEKILPFSLPIDEELQYWQAALGLQVYWGEPSLALQGSEVGFYRSTVEGRSVSASDS